MDQIVKICHEDADKRITEKTTPGFSLDSDSEDEPEGVDIDLSGLDEKSSAINALGIIGMNSPVLFSGRMQEFLSALEKN